MCLVKDITMIRVNDIFVRWAESKIFVESEKRKIRARSDYIGRAANRCLFTGAIPLLHDTETFACWVSPLGRFVSP